MLMEVKCLFGEPTYAILQKQRQADFEIKTDPNGKVPFHSLYRIWPHEEEASRRQIDKVIRCGWTQPSRSNFSSPVLFVRKPDGMLRMSIDSRAVNATTVKDCYPLKHIDDSLNSIHSSCCFTKLDFVSGYDQIRITTDDRQKPAFRTNFGLYEWQVLPCGLANAPSQFRRMINGILEQMNRKIFAMYLNDIMIHSHTLVEHVVHVHQVLTLLTEHGLKAKLAKCAWACQKIDFYGFGIQKDSIHAQEHKTHAVMDWPQPDNSKDVRGFLGLTSYYRNVIEHYTHIAMPLYAIVAPPKGKGEIGR